MKKHIEIRKAVMGAIKAGVKEKGVTFYDGRPGFLDVQDLPAIAVYLSDAECVEAGTTLGEYGWKAILHAEVFMKSITPDTTLDNWVEQYLYPALRDSAELESLTITSDPQGYDYQRDEEMMTWGSADLRFDITYHM